jgi:hypothetical protein
MVIFKCPYCRTEYEMTTAHLSFQQWSYAKCQVCHQTMYSWNSRNVPIFTLMNASKGEIRHQPLLEGLFSRPVSGLNGFIKDR